jgi:hypothetical protein
MLDDLIFMILYMHQVPEVVDFMEFIGLHESCMQSKRIIMYDDFSEVTRNELYRLVKANSDFSKIAICLFEGSILKDSLKNLNEYTCDVEVLMSSYRREYSRWEGAQIVTGSL